VAPADAVSAAATSVGAPRLTAESIKRLTITAARAGRRPGRAARVTRHNALRHLILSSPDYQVS
jgi:hypothetical protein